MTVFECWSSWTLTLPRYITTYRTHVRLCWRKLFPPASPHVTAYQQNTTISPSHFEMFLTRFSSWRSEKNISYTVSILNSYFREMKLLFLAVFNSSQVDCPGSWEESTISFRKLQIHSKNLPPSLARTYITHAMHCLGCSTDWNMWFSGKRWSSKLFKYHLMLYALKPVSAAKVFAPSVCSKKYYYF